MRILISIAFVSLLVPSASAEDPRSDRAHSQRRYEDAERWAQVWDHPSRHAWQEPGRVVEWMEVEQGMRVVDLGAGTGYFNPWLSEAVGPDGIVYAVDVSEEMVEHMRIRAEQEGTANVVALLAAPDDPRLPVETVDRILLVDTYHHIDHRVAYFTALRARLERDGLLVNVDWKPGPLELGPSESHKIAPEKVAAELAEAGYELLATHELRFQYVQVFRPVTAPGD